MISKGDVPTDFYPDFLKRFVIKGDEIMIGLHYHGPIPMFGQPPETETFYYMVRFVEHFETGKIEWDPYNGVLTYEQLSQSLALLWDPEQKKLNFNS